jgi:hypothetical protein
MRRLLAILSLTVALAVPSATLAATTSGTVSESLTASVSVAATIPTSATYTMAGSTASATINISGIDTALASNVTITVQPNAGGGGLIDYTKRSMTIAQTGGFTTTNILVGDWSSATVKTIATKAGNVTAGSLTVTSNVQVTAPGTYTGTLNFVVSAS